MEMEIDFPSGLEVRARFGDHSVLTDQPVRYGGGGAAPAPFDLFLASIGTCAGFYALRFCQKRELDTAGLGLKLRPVRDPESHRLDRVELDLELPESFPEKYAQAIIRAIDQCAVKRSILDPPEIVTRLHPPLAART